MGYAARMQNGQPMILSTTSIGLHDGRTKAVLIKDIIIPKDGAEILVSRGTQFVIDLDSESFNGKEITFVALIYGLHTDVSNDEYQLV